MTPGVSIPEDASIPVFDFYLFLFFSLYIRISGNLWSGMTCSWCDGGLEGTTRVCVFVCACGFVPAGGSGHRLLPLNSGHVAPRGTTGPEVLGWVPTPAARVAAPRATGSLG